jgi:hypothetical protein
MYYFRWQRNTFMQLVCFGDSGIRVGRSAYQVGSLNSLHGCRLLTVLWAVCTTHTKNNHLEHILIFHRISYCPENCNKNHRNNANIVQENLLFIACNFLEHLRCPSMAISINSHPDVATGLLLTLLLRWSTLVLPGILRFKPEDKKAS